MEKIGESFLSRAEVFLFNFIGVALLYFVSIWNKMIVNYLAVVLYE